MDIAPRGRLFTELENALHDVSLIVQDVDSILEVRIQTALFEMEVLELAVVPSSKPWTVKEFVENTRERTDEASVILDTLSQNAKQATQDIIDLVQQGLGLENYRYDSRNCSIDVHMAQLRYDLVTRKPSFEMRSILKNHVLYGTPIDFSQNTHIENEFRDICSELFNVMHNRTRDTVLKCVKSSLDMIKKRLLTGRHQFSYAASRSSRSSDSSPMLSTEVVLHIPDVVVSPSLDVIQAEVNIAVNMIIQASSNVQRWFPLPEQNLPCPTTMSVADHKDILKIANNLSSSIQIGKAQVNEYLEKYHKYKYLWTNDKNEIVAEFLKSEPILSDFCQEMDSYTRAKEAMLIEFGQAYHADSLALVTKPVRESIKCEIQNWILQYANTARSVFCKRLTAVVTKFDALEQKLSRQVADLDGVRNAMNTINDFKQYEIWCDSEINQIEDCYAVLSKMEIQMPKEEVNLCDSIRYESSIYYNKYRPL